MASPSTSATPLPCRSWVNKARKKHNAGNGGKANHGSIQLIKSPIDEKLYSLLTSDQCTKRSKNGSFYRLGWSTVEEREAERIRAGI